MSNSGSQTTLETTADMIQCPSCRGEIGPSVKRCPHCGRPMGRHGLFFYTFWAGLSLVVAALMACIIYVGFLLLNRML
jgi:predicted amidophosphoribosyltransferase